MFVEEDGSECGGQLGRGDGWTDGGCCVSLDFGDGAAVGGEEQALVYVIVICESVYECVYDRLWYFARNEFGFKETEDEAGCNGSCEGDQEAAGEAA